MAKVRLLAACVALTLVVAACGDDDDASGDTTPETIAVAADESVAEEPAPAATAAAGTPAPSADAAPAPSADAAPTVPAGETSPEVAADCLAIRDSIDQEGFEDAPEDPEVGEQISDEYKDAARTLVDQFQGVELQTEEVQSGVDQFIVSIESIIDADEWSEQIDATASEAFTPLLTVCDATFATANASR